MGTSAFLMGRTMIGKAEEVRPSFGVFEHTCISALVNVFWEDFDIIFLTQDY